MFSWTNKCGPDELSLPIIFDIDDNLLTVGYKIYIAATALPTLKPTHEPTFKPTLKPTHGPTLLPTVKPTGGPTLLPTLKPTGGPTLKPTLKPTLTPTSKPTGGPTLLPTVSPSIPPIYNPSLTPSKGPSLSPTFKPTSTPSYTPSLMPVSIVRAPTFSPTIDQLGNMCTDGIDICFYAKNGKLFYNINNDNTPVFKKITIVIFSIHSITPNTSFDNSRFS